MLYPFPPPTYFDPGTMSLMLLTIWHWVFVIGLPVSILACLCFKPKSRVVWILAESFWLFSAVSSFVLWAQLQQRWLSTLQDVEIPTYLKITARYMTMLLTVPAVLAGFQELFRQTEHDRGFHSLPTWLCAMIVLFFVGQIVTAGCIYHPTEVARRNQCKQNLKQIGWAMHNYHDQFSRFPDPQTSTEESPPVSWRVSILPYIEHKKPSVKYDSAAAWNSVANSPIAQSDVGIYVCPSVPNRTDPIGRYYSAYATLSGSGTSFEDGRGKSTRDFTDGTSNTALVVEACGQQIAWTEPRDIEVSKDNLGLNLSGNDLGQSPAVWSSYHRHGAFTLLADGSVRFLSNSTDPTVLKAISTVSGDETLRDF